MTCFQLEEKKAGSYLIPYPKTAFCTDSMLKHKSTNYWKKIQKTISMINGGGGVLEQDETPKGVMKRDCLWSKGCKATDKSQLRTRVGSMELPVLTR